MDPTLRRHRIVFRQEATEIDQISIALRGNRQMEWAGKSLC